MFEKNKNLIIYSVIGLIILVFVYFIFNNFILTADTETGELSLSPKTKTSPVKINVNLEKLDTSIFEDARFMELKYYKVSRPDIGELKIGKENPFSK